MAFPISIQLLFYFIVFIGCNNKEEKSYDVENKGKDCSTTKYFYSNGQLASIGNICDSMKNGYWKEYYPNGSLKWRGEYINGIRNYSKIKHIKKCNLYFDKDTSILFIDSIYHFRIDVQGIHPEDLIISSNNGNMSKSEDDANYNYKLVPNKKSNLKLKIYFPEFKDSDLIYEKIFAI